MAIKKQVLVEFKVGRRSDLFWVKKYRVETQFSFQPDGDNEGDLNFKSCF